MHSFVSITIWFWLGAIAGSTVLCIVERLQQDMPQWGRSQCLHCHHTLNPLDLIPILNVLWLRGRCRYCGTHYPRRTLYIELLMAIAFVCISIGIEPVSRQVTVAVVTLVMVGLSLEDYFTRFTHDLWFLPWWVCSLVDLALGHGPSLASRLIGAMVLGGLLLGLHLCVPQGLGIGDAIMTATYGFYLGIGAGSWSFLLGTWSACVLAFIQVRRGRWTRQYALPFVPFLSFGCWISIFGVPGFLGG